MPEMTVSGPKCIDQQAALWDMPIRSPAQVRNIIGDLAERLTVELTGGVRHKTDSTADYCPDVVDGDDYFESKAAGRSRITFVYGGRLHKEDLFTLQIKRLWYVVWHHTAKTTGIGTVEALEKLVLVSMKAVYVVPFPKVLEVCGRLKVEKLNSGYGGTDRKTYGSGYRIPLRLLEDFILARYENGYLLDKVQEGDRAGNAPGQVRLARPDGPAA